SLYAAAVHLRQVAHYRQSEPYPPLPARARAVALAEAVEDERQKVRSDSEARVADRDFDILPYAFQLHLDLSSVGSELDRVCNQVPHDLAETVGIARHRARLIV